MPGHIERRPEAPDEPPTASTAGLPPPPLKGAGSGPGHPWRLPLRFGIGIMAVVCLTVGVMVRSDVVKLHRSQALDRRGHEVTATVEALRYDEGGGDPDGVTTLRVDFVTADGVTEEAVVWHHRPPTESVGGPISVVYDPLDPTNVEAVGSHVDLVPEVALGVAILTASVLGLVAVLIGERVAARRAKPQGN